MYRSKLYSIKNLSLENRPRERLVKLGAESISDDELLAIILGHGTVHVPLNILVNEITHLRHKKQAERKKISLDDLLQIKGLGKAKGAQILAVLELGKRWSRKLSSPITHPLELFPYIENFFSSEYETVVSISLNAGNQIIRARLVSQGTINRTIMHPREVLSDIITDRSTSFIVAHNHPSNSLEPSSEDKEITERLIQASTLIGIPLLDHIIYGTDTYFSFREENLLK